MVAQKFEDKYEVLEKIGAGTFSVVKKARAKNGVLVAVKFVKPHGTDKLPPHVIRETSFLKGIKHQNVIRLLDVYLEGVPLFVYELMETDLHDVLHKIPNFKLPEADIVTYTSHCIAGLEAIHDLRIIHRDLKPANICISRDGIAKICDLGSARATCSDVPVPYTREVTTLYYRSPEIILGAESYSYPVDVWALGCVLGEMILGRPYFQATSEIGMIFQIFMKLGTPDSTVWPNFEKLLHWRSDLPSFPVPSRQAYRAQRDDVTDLAYDMMFEMLMCDPNKRLTVQSAKEHAFLRPQSEQSFV